MTTATNDTIEQFTISGAGPYAYSWRIFNDTDLTVVALSTDSPPDVVPLTYLTHYTVTGANESDGGSITLLTAAYTPYAGYTLDIRANTPQNQLTSIRNQARFLPEIHEDAFDYLSRQVQDMQRRLDRTVRFSDDNLTDGEMSPIQSWLSKYLVIGPTGLLEPADLTSSGALTATILGELLYPRTAAEIAAGVTPTSYFYPPFYARRYGFETTASAAVNSVALQAASEVAYQAGGAEIIMHAGTFSIDAPPLIFETVSIRGAGKNSTILKKTTATQSTVSDPTAPFYGGGAVGFPICVMHFVAHNGTGNWAYATCRDFQVQGDTSSPNTTAVIYGLFFRGATGCEVTDNFAQFVQVGFFFAGGATITSRISGNNAGNVQRGFYQDFMTSTDFSHNYANKFRYAGYYLAWYYSNVFNNAADNVGSPWKVGTTEISLAYQGNSCRGGAFFGNGCETHNGSVFKFSNCLSVRFFSNLAIDITSDYTGGSDIVLWENDSNNSCVYEDNRMQTTSMTGTGARHFIYKITTELGNYVWQRNRFVANVTDNTDTSTWANISGTIVETFALIHTIGTFTPTVLGSTVAGVTTYGTRNGSYERIGNTVWFRIRVTWTNMTGTGNIVVGGLPFTSENTENAPVSILADSLTFANQLACCVRPNSTNIDPFTMSTGAAAANVAVDVAATLWITGVYNTV